MNRRIVSAVAACAAIALSQSALAGVHIGVGVGGYYAPPVVVAPGPPPPIREEVVPVPVGRTPPMWAAFKYCGCALIVWV
jgi:hypothetical protein